MCDEVALDARFDAAIAEQDQGAPTVRQIPGMYLLLSTVLWYKLPRAKYVRYVQNNIAMIITFAYSLRRRR